MYLSESSTKRYDIVAFKVPKHRSLLYDTLITRERLHKALDAALDREANVISIRESEI